MPTPNDYKEAWIQKSKIDYFGPFISLWLACNSWYRSHYSDLENATDRTFIDKIKSDFSRRNHLYVRFKDLLAVRDEQKQLALKTNLELLMFGLNRTVFQPERLKYQCSFQFMLIDYARKDDETAYINIVHTPRINRDGTIHNDDRGTVIKLDTVFITSNIDQVFAGLFELIYQIRNMVIHGHVNPNKEEHEIIKLCYFILCDMMGI